MKKLLTAMLVVLLLLALVGCSEQANSPTTPEETPTVIDATPAPPEQASPTPIDEEVGVIIGDIFYNDIPISQLFTEPFIDVLGSPIDEREAFFFYEGLEIMGDRGDLVGYDNMAIQLWAFEPNLSLFALDRVSLDMTRAELIAAFGAPYVDVVDHDHSLTYRISSLTIEYMVTFQFEDSSNDIPVSSISIGLWHETDI